MRARGKDTMDVTRRVCMSQQKVTVARPGNSQRPRAKDFQWTLAMGRHSRINGYRSQITVCQN